MEQEKSPYAFIGRFPFYRNRIVSEIMLCNPEEGRTGTAGIRALWDTGCSMSVVSKRVADFLRLPVRGNQTLKTPFGVKRTCDVVETDICVLLGGEKVRLRVAVNEKPNSDLDCDMTLGLDFITQGDFALTHDGEQLCLSFCYPKIGHPTDFTLIAPRITRKKHVTVDFVIDETSAHEEQVRRLRMEDVIDDMTK